MGGAGQTAAAHDLCSGIEAGHRKHLEAKGAGHYGIFSGRRWREVVYPTVKRFILDHQATAASGGRATAEAAGKAVVPSTPVKATAPAKAVAETLGKPTARAKTASSAKASAKPSSTKAARGPSAKA